MDSSQQGKSLSTTRRMCVRFAWAISAALCLPPLHAGQATTQTLPPASPLSRIEGHAETRPVPMVAEPWAATVSAVATKPPKQVRFIGHCPSYEAAKLRANRAAQQRLRTPYLRNAVATPLLAPQVSVATPVVFNGPSESDTNIIPPDPQIAAGPTYLVVAINSLLAIYDKTGLLQGSFQPLSSFFSSLGVSGSIYDPRIIYDPTDNRFILSAAEVDQTNLTNGNVLVAVSQTSDPTGVWYKYAIDFKGRNPSNTVDTFPDFPTLGLSSSAIYISTGQFMLNASCLQSHACSFSDTWIKVLALPELLGGNPALNITTFTNVQTVSGIPAFAIEPALTHGASAEEFLVAASFASNPGTTLDLFAINTSGTPTLATEDLHVPPFAIPPDAAQPGTGPAIATNDFRLLNAVWANGALWCSQNIADSTGANAVAAWYEINLSNLSTASLGQSGTITGSGTAYFPAISLKPNGDVGLVFTTSSFTQYASAGFTGRSASDAPNTMRTFSIYMAGTAAYSDLALRWGDFSGIAVDPDGNSFWMIAEYAGSPNPHFGTAIAQAYSFSPLDSSSTQLNFGNQTVDVTSEPQSVTITNASANSVVLASAAIIGPNAGEFAISSDTCSGATLTPTSTCAIAVTFTPAAIATRTAVLTFNQSPGSFPLYIYLVGAGVPASGAISVSPEALTFPGTPLRTVSNPLNVKVTNSGTVAVPLTFTFGGTMFAETNNCGTALNAGQSCQISVTFRPSVAGVISGDLDVYYPTVPSGSTFPRVNLQGNGITAPAVTPCPASVNFGNQRVGTSSAPQSVTINNTGSSNLTISSLTMSGDFAQTSPCGALPLTLPARSACDLQVTFTPTTTGTRTGTITILDNATGSPQKVALTGTGVAATAALHRLEILPLPDRTSLAASDLRQAPLPAMEQRVIRSYGELSLHFEANRGQTDPPVRFLARPGGYTLFLTNSEAVLSLQTPGPESRTPGGGRMKLEKGDSILEARNSKLPPRLPEPPVQVPSVLRMSLVNANANPRVQGLDELPGKSSYFLGNESRTWRTNVPHYARVEYRNVYPGVDLIYHGHLGRLEYDFVVAPGADPKAIELWVESWTWKLGPGNSELENPKPKIVLAADGGLVIQTDAGKVRFHKPIVYQPAESRQSSVVSGQLHSPTNNEQRTTNDLNSPFTIQNSQFCEGRYVLTADNRVQFEIPKFDRRRPLVIDPELTYSTYLGGNGPDQANGIAVDSAGNAYVTGSTASADFPIANAFQATINGTYSGISHAFVTKISADGSSLLYSTYLGGTYNDAGNGIAVDATGNAYITGNTSSSGFPVTPGAFQTTFKVSPNTAPGFGSNAFVTKLSADGSALVYSTYLGGSYWDEGHAIAIDSAGNAYVAGRTLSTDFPATSGAVQPAFAEHTAGQCPASPWCGNGFVASLNASGSSLLYSTYLGGSSDNSANGIAVDSAGNAYVVGTTSSNDFPVTAGAYQTGISSNPENAFVAKLNPQGTGLIYSTYLGGEGSLGSSIIGDQASAIAIDNAGNAYVAGQTNSANFPITPNAFQPTSYNNYNPFGDAFVTKLHPAGCGLVYSTYLGGFWSDFANAIAVDSSGSAYVAGGTVSPDFPTVNPLQASCVPFGAGGVSIACPFVSRLDPSGSTLIYSTFLSGTNSESYILNKASAVAIDTVGDAYIAGHTAATDFPTFHAIDSTYHGQGDGFVAKINPTNVASIALSPAKLTFPNTPAGTPSAPLTVTLTNQTSGAVNINGATTNIPFSVSTNNCATVEPGASCEIGVQFTPSDATPWSNVLTINDNAFAGPHVVPLYGTGFTAPTATFSSQDLISGVLTFGSTPLGTSLGPAQVTLRNNGSATLNIAGITISGDFTKTTDCGSTLTGNSQCDINGTFTPTAPGIRTGTLSATDNAADSPQTLPITGSSGDFSVSATPTSSTVAAGQSTSYKISVAPLYQLTGTVALACSGAPSEATCNISPNSLRLNGTDTATANLTVSTTASSRVRPPLRPPVLPPATRFRSGSTLWVLALVLFASLLAAQRQARRRALTLLAVALLVASSWASCGGGGGGSSGGGNHNPGTPPGTYTLQVAGTSGSGSLAFTHTLNLTLTVN